MKSLRTQSKLIVTTALLCIAPIACDHTGLGLSIVKHLVQIHGGKVWAKSGLEQGTQITLTLPCRGG